MPSSNQSRLKTAFTISIEARKGVTTGISAHDRCRTILTAIKSTSSTKDISTPGHIFPLVARNGGSLVRAGHTEASVDIAKLSKCGSSAVICEIMNEDGTMAKGSQLLRYAKKHNLKIAKIEDLISYRLKKENQIYLKDKKFTTLDIVLKKDDIILFEYTWPSTGSRPEVSILVSCYQIPTTIQEQGFKKSFASSTSTPNGKESHISYGSGEIKIPRENRQGSNDKILISGFLKSLTIN